MGLINYIKWCLERNLKPSLGTTLSKYKNAQRNKKKAR